MSDDQRYVTDAEKLAVAAEQARIGLAEGGIPIGAALFDGEGRLLGAGHNKRVQDDDASVHGETDAFRAAGRQRSYRDTTMATTLSPCWYCSGLIRQFGIGRVIVGEDVNFMGGQDWVAEHGAEVHVVEDPALIAMMRDWIAEHPALWNEDIGED
jgi:cytosine deaminase